MNPHLQDIISRATGATTISHTGSLQALWSGYGSIDRYRLSGSDRRSVIVKHVRFPDGHDHPRGWSTGRSDQRKRRSYEVETHWYEHWASRCDPRCHVPDCLGVEHRAGEVIMVLEDLAESGYVRTPQTIDQAGMQRVLAWLAHFHATFMGEPAEGLWPTGCYWHLDTRPDELAAMDDQPLRDAAPTLDRLLKEAPYQTFVHGDAKLANFCFSADGDAVAAVDFQYVGGGCGMKDLAYFIGSCLDERQCEARQASLLDSYFEALADALAQRRPGIDSRSVEAAWRPLYAVAWTDFHRFLKGWSPGHWKINSYSERLAAEVIAGLNP